MRQYLKSLYLHDFRSHEKSAFDFGPGINLLFGPNGAGKTNALEAIHYACLGKSFLTSNDRYAVRDGATYFEVTANFDADGSTSAVRITSVPGEGKRIAINKAPLDRLSDVLGRYPLVIHAPDDHVITSGPPEERRRFVDNVLCQHRPAYTTNLIRYRRVVKQRNAALQGIRYRGANPATLEGWNHELVALGARIAASRLDFAAEFERYLRDAYDQLTVIRETPSLTYVGAVRDAHSVEEYQSAFLRRVQELRAQEIESARTLAGPHRDEFRLSLDGRELRRYASQGQHRTFGMALKLAQYRYLAERCQATPILLLDDAFAHLDPERRDAFSRLVADSGFGQTIMTAASQTTLAPLLRRHVGDGLHLIEVPRGQAVDYLG